MKKTKGAQVTLPTLKIPLIVLHQIWSRHEKEICIYNMLHLARKWAFISLIFLVSISNLLGKRALTIKMIDSILVRILKVQKNDVIVTITVKAANYVRIYLQSTH